MKYMNDLLKTAKNVLQKNETIFNGDDLQVIYKMIESLKKEETENEDYICDYVDSLIYSIKTCPLENENQESKDIAEDIAETLKEEFETIKDNLGWC